MAQGEHEQETDPAKPRRLVGRLKWLTGILVLLAVAPTLTMMTGQQNALLRLVLPELADSVSFDRATTHWWAPVELTGVSVRDLSAELSSEQTAPPLLTVESIRSRQPLWRIALALGRGTEITLQQPALNLRVAEGRTNLELTAEQMFGPSTGGSAGFPMVVNVESGSVRLLPADSSTTMTGPATSIKDINGRISTTNAQASLPEVSLAATIQTAQLLSTDSRERGRPTPARNSPRIAAALDHLTRDQPLLPFTPAEVEDLERVEESATVRLDIQPAQGEPGGQRCVFEVHSVELSTVAPVLQRFLGDISCEGSLSCRFDGLVAEDSDSLAFAGRTWLLGQRVRWRSSAWAPGESVQLDRVTMEGAWACASDGILVNGLKIESALLNVTGQGEVRKAQSDPVRLLQDAAKQRGSEVQAVVDEAQAATTGNIRLDARIDAAALTRMLPRTLRIDEGVQVQSAEINGSLRIGSVVATNTGPASLDHFVNPFRWQFAAVTSAIDATKNGRSIQIPAPMRFGADGDLTLAGLTLHKASVDGAFGLLTIAPEGSAYRLSGEIDSLGLWDQIQPVLNIPRPGLRSPVRVTSKLKLTDNGLYLSDTSLTSRELKFSSPSFTVHHARPVLETLEGQFVLEGESAALKMLVAPWHSATWLSDNSAVSISLNAEPGRRFAVDMSISPANVSTSATQGVTGRSMETDRSPFVIDEAIIRAGLIADAAGETFVVENSHVDLPGLRAQISGNVSAPDGILMTSLDADVQYDLAVLSQEYLAAYATEFQLIGQGRSLFRLRGSPLLLTDADLANLPRTLQTEQNLQTARLEASGDIEWQGGRLLGLVLGPGRAEAQLKDGLLRTAPVHCSLGSGELDAMPQWDLNHNLIQLASGSRIRNLELSQKFCGEWLGYVAPLLADAATVQGTVSARVQRFDLYPDNPWQSEIQGGLTVHGATASAGPSLLPLLQLLELISKRSLADRNIQIAPQDVSVAVSQGFVSHDRLELDVAGYRVVSSGRVGVSQQVDLLLDIATERGTPGQQVRSVQLPVGGTIKSPRIDTGGLLQNLGRQQIENRVNEQLDRGLNKLLNKLR